MPRYLLFVLAAIVLVAGLAWCFRPPQPEAFALLRVADKSPVVIDRADNTNEDFAIFKRTQVQLMLSGPVLRGTVREPSIEKLPLIQMHKDNAVAWLHEHLAIDFPDDAEIMRVSLRGGPPEELKQVVDMVVRKYLSEVVAAGREERLQQEGRLEKKYHDTTDEFTKQAEALYNLERLNKTSTTEVAEIERRLAVENLEEAVATRNFLKRQILENELQINLLKAKAETSPPETRTADPPAPAPAADDEASLRVLERQQEFLERKLQDADGRIQQIAKSFDNLERYSATLAAKREELVALKDIMIELKAQLDRTQIERLARERVTKIDDAMVSSTQAHRGQRYGGLAVAALASLGLVVLGLAAGRRTST